MRIKLIKAAFVLLTAIVSSSAMAQEPGQDAGNAQCTDPIFKSNEVDQKLKILAKPEPAYTKEDRRGHAHGAIVLRAVFCGSGKVTDVTVKSGLSDDLNERAIEAARKIRFVPAEKDGRKVSQVLTVEYHINL